MLLKWRTSMDNVELDNQKILFNDFDETKFKKTEDFMYKRIISLLLTFTLVFGTISMASPKPKDDVSMTVYPATKTTINGIPESQLVTPYVVYPWIFSHYDPNVNSVTNKFKKIVQYDHDNTASSAPYVMNVTITSSTAQGSEWTGDISFTAAVKTGIMSGLEIETGYSYKDSRSTNEAVGVGGTYTVNPGKTGHIAFWYKGSTTSGSAVFYRYNDYTGTNDYDYKPISAKFYKKNYMDIFSESWQN